MELNVNGRRQRLDVDPARSLLSVLRDDLDLTGTKYGCGEAQCGACTVLVDGTPTRSCVTRVDAVRGAQVTTIEGLAKDSELHPLQAAFLEVEALQCGYCTPGMIVQAAALLESQPKPSEAEIRRHMEGHVCRCGTYPRIVRAIAKAAAALEGGDK